MGKKTSSPAGGLPSQMSIAKAAGVSRATVSMVLNGGAGPSEKTAEKVREVAVRFGYRPNALVRGIKSGHSQSLGIFLQPVGSFWASVLGGIHDQAMDSHYALLLCMNRLRIEEQVEEASLQQVNDALDRRVDGAIFGPFYAEVFERNITEFTRRQVPVVTIDHILPAGMGADAVLADEEKLARDLADYLLAAGQRKFLIVANARKSYWAIERPKAIATQLRTQPGVEIETITVDRTAEHTWQPVVAAMQARRATCVIAITDIMALRVYELARDLGLEMPRDLSIVGVGDQNFSRLIAPPLTTMRQHGDIVGRAAARLLIERIQGVITGNPQVRRVPATLVVRDSVARIAPS